MTSGQRTYLPYLDVTRILAVLGVVAIHVVSGGVADGEVGIAVTALDMALKVAVPIFFMMSGALSLDPAAHRHGPGHFLRRRARRIVPALVVWSAFYLIVIEGFVSGNPVGSLTELMDLLVRGKTYTHLYFLRDRRPVPQPGARGLLEQDERPCLDRGPGRPGWTVAVISVGQAGGSRRIPPLRSPPEPHPSCSTPAISCSARLVSPRRPAGAGSWAWPRCPASWPW